MKFFPRGLWSFLNTAVLEELRLVFLEIADDLGAALDLAMDQLRVLPAGARLSALIRSRTNTPDLDLTYGCVCIYIFIEIRMCVYVHSYMHGWMDEWKTGWLAG